MKTYKQKLYAIHNSDIPGMFCVIGRNSTWGLLPVHYGTFDECCAYAYRIRQSEQNVAKILNP